MRSGLLVPLFSCPSTDSWGIGDIGDLAPLTAWLAGAGQRVLQLLPINEMAPGQQSPYSAISAMAIDPIFIRPADVPEFAALGGEASLGAEDRALLAAVRQSTRVEYASARRLKDHALRAAFDRFEDAEWRSQTVRAQALSRFVAEQAWWLDGYALFRAIHAREEERPWTGWPAGLRDREPGALDEARRELEREMRFQQYLQWLAATEWQQARASARSRGVALFGDLPFMVDGDSADVWAHQHQFRLDASVGVPPDAFSATGQDWGMPVYRWDELARDDYRWLRARAQRSADLYDGYRVDHLVGFYRTYARPHDGGPAYFTPAEERAQAALGERLLGIFREPGAAIIAEDLGTVPDFVRASLARLGVPGFRVGRWEREWHLEGQPFRDTSEYPVVSVATTGTHDTEPLRVWWETASAEERRAFNQLPSVQRLTGGAGLPDAPFVPAVRDAIVAAMFEASSELVLFPVQDVFGWSDRINQPATVNDHNWTFRLPWAVDRLDTIPEARERQLALRREADRSGRS